MIEIRREKEMEFLPVRTIIMVLERTIIILNKTSWLLRLAVAKQITDASWYIKLTGKWKLFIMYYTQSWELSLYDTEQVQHGLDSGCSELNWPQGSIAGNYSSLLLNCLKRVLNPNPKMWYTAAYQSLDVVAALGPFHTAAILPLFSRTTKAHENYLH